jgi:hypothetical protein
MDAHWLVTPEDGDRYPVGPPSLRMLTANSNFTFIEKKKMHPVFYIALDFWEVLRLST